MKKNFENILVVRTDRIGDVLLTTPAIATLRKAYPDSKISILVSPATRELVEGNPHLNEVIIDDKNGKHKGLFGFIDLVYQIRRKNFDLAIIYHTKKRTNSICFLAGIPDRIGFKNDKFGFLLNHPLDDIRTNGTKHESEYCLEVLKHIGVRSNELSLYMPIKENSENWAQRFIFENGISEKYGFIIIHPGASCISKRWPVKSFIELINQLQNKYFKKIVLIGDEKTRNIADEIILSTNGSVIDAVEITSLSQLASLLKRSDILISNDSGPVHIAVAVGTPVISIFGRNQAGLSPVRWRPLGPKDSVFHKEVGCKICTAHNCSIGFICLEKITVSEVLEKIDSLFSK